MSGCWLFVCGPSGAGKDAVIGWTQQALGGDERIVFARRLVTRAAPGGPDHEETSRGALQALYAAGDLAWYWEANGHAYGVRAAYRQHVQAGRLVVVNGSREHAAGLASRPDVRSVLVTADAALLHARLRARARESGAAVAQRLARNEQVPQPRAERIIVNDGPVAAAGAALHEYLMEICP